MDPSPIQQRTVPPDDSDIDEGVIGVNVPHTQGSGIAPEGLLSIACGAKHAAAVVDGDAVTWGRAQGGRLGQGDIIEV